MITAFALKHKDVSQEESWKFKLATAIKDPFELLKELDLANDENKSKVYLADKFKLFVTRSYVKKMKKGDWNDPLLKQVLPVLEENKVVSGFVSDPVGDLNAEISSGLLHKYQGRVLLVTTGACPVHCRYCFRRHFSYADSLPDKKHWQKTLSTIRNDNSISEVILSGGDPLMLSDDRLQKMCFELAEIPHVKTLRFHTRIPIFLPERINAAFLSWTKRLAIQKVMVIHANHANELDEQVDDVLNKLSKVGFTLLNQSVLLKEINDDVDTLVDLSEKLFSMKVLPYYLHQLDRVQGAAHFEVDKKMAISLVESLKEQLPGYLVPRLVEEISGKRSKQAIV